MKTPMPGRRAPATPETLADLLEPLAEIGRRCRETQKKPTPKQLEEVKARARRAYSVARRMQGLSA